jgi:tRNA-binding EMAP/Myf-like protein
VRARSLDLFIQSCLIFSGVPRHSAGQAMRSLRLVAFLFIKKKEKGKEKSEGEGVASEIRIEKYYPLES